MLKTILTRALVAIALFAQSLRAEEEHSILTSLSSTTLSGFVDTSFSWWAGQSMFSGGRPPNDNAQDAFPISNSAYSFPVRNFDATLQEGESLLTDHAAGQTVWYNWTSPKSGILRVSSSPQDWIVPIVGLCRVVESGLLRLASLGHYPSNFTTSISVQENETIFIVVDTATSGFPTYASEYYSKTGGVFSLTYLFSGSTTNDFFSNASEIALGTNSCASLAGATLEEGELRQPGQTASLWFKWVPPDSGIARFSGVPLGFCRPAETRSFIPALSEESIFYPWGGIGWNGDGSYGSEHWTSINRPFTAPLNFSVYRGTALSNLIKVAGGADLEFPVSASETLWIAVESYDPLGGFPMFGSKFYVDLVAPPANDQFSSAYELRESAAGIFTGHAVGATRENGEPDLNSAYAGGSVWFHFTAATYGRVQLGMDTEEFPVAVFRGSSIEDLRLITKNPSGAVEFFGEPGSTYHIAVYRGTAHSGSFSLNIRGPRYRLYETTFQTLMPPGMQPHFYGVRGATILLYAKSATGWDCVEIEPIVNFSADLLIRPNAVDGQLRVITIDETLPAPRVQLRAARGLLVPDVIGYPGQTCAISYSTDLINWSASAVHTLTSAPLSLGAVSAAVPTHFFRVTQSLPQPTSPPVILQPQPPAETHGGFGISSQMIYSEPRGNVPPPPLPLP